MRTTFSFKRPGFIASGKSVKKLGFTRNFWKVRDSQGKSGKKFFFVCLVRESQGKISKLK